MNEVDSGRRCGRCGQSSEQGPDCTGPGYVVTLPAPDPEWPSPITRGGGDTSRWWAGVS